MWVFLGCLDIGKGTYAFRLTALLGVPPQAMGQAADLPQPMGQAAALKPPFLEMHLIIAAITARNLEPALNWAPINGDKLEQNGADLELKLHRL